MIASGPGASTSLDISNAFSTFSRQRVEALIVTRDTFFNQQVRQIADLAVTNRLPVIAGIGQFVDAGVLMSYGTNVAALYYRAAAYVDKIFKGARPADLSVEQPNTYELVINRKTAKALGLTIPQSLLISADRVVE